MLRTKHFQTVFASFRAGASEGIARLAGVSSQQDTNRKRSPEAGTGNRYRAVSIPTLSETTCLMTACPFQKRGSGAISRLVSPIHSRRSERTGGRAFALPPVHREVATERYFLVSVNEGALITHAATLGALAER